MNGKTTAVEAVSATELLRGDHRRIRDLFRDFESVDRETKNYIARTAIEEIELHALLEEKLFYPMVRSQVEEAQELVAQALEAHHLAKILITELKVIPYGDRYHAKFAKLCDTFLDHIKEEEEVLFPMVERSDVDLQQLGLEMARLKMRAVSKKGLSLPFVGFGRAAALIALGTVAAIGVALFARSRSRRPGQRTVTKE